MEEELRSTLSEAPGFGRAVDADSDTDDFEFAFSSIESNPGALTGTPADEIFSNGRILPVYPVFSRNLISGGLDASGEEKLAQRMDRLALPFENRDMRSGSVSSSTMSSEAGDLEDLPGSEAEYCVWTPRSAPQSPDRWKKSSSTGSELPEFRKFRLRDLVIGRSRSDGKEKIVLFPEAEKKMKSSGSRPSASYKPGADAGEKGTAGKGKGRPVKELDVITAHRVYYEKRAAGGRRSFLPYRQNLLLGFFGNGNRHPF